MADKIFKTVPELKRQSLGVRAAIVVEMLAVMERVVNQDKSVPVTAADWAPFAALVDEQRFHRVGNFGEEVDWSAYLNLLVGWANHGWFEDHVWRLREIPATADEPALVLIESEERSRIEGPVNEGPYTTLASAAVYEFDAADRIVGLHVYDQRPQ
jgi:hypothetical protein